MKKVLLYIGSLKRGGAERVMANIASFLAEKFEVILATDLLSLDTEDEYSIDPRVIRISFGIVRGGIKGNLKRIRRLRRIIKTERPAAVLSFLGPSNLRALVAGIGLKTRIIVSVRNDPYYEYGSGLKKAIARLLFNNASGCVFQTEEAKSYFPKRVQKKSVVIWNPVADKFFAHHWEPKREEIAVVGRLSKQKNPLLALDAFKEVASDYPYLSLAYYGSGELKQEVSDKAKEYGLSDRVKIIDNVPNIEEYVESARIFVLSSDFEGMPNALMEAMTVGIPCIATDCPCGGPKAISHGFNDLMLVPCNDAMAIEARMRALLDDENKQIELSSKERERSSLFRMDYVMKQWESFLFKD